MWTDVNGFTLLPLPSPWGSAPLPMSPCPCPSPPTLWLTVPLVCRQAPDAHEGGGIPLLLRHLATSPTSDGSRTSDLSLGLARGGADSFCLRARRYLHHAPTRTHTRPPIHTTPLRGTTLHSHLPADYTHAPHSHLYFGYEQPAGAHTFVPTVAKDSAPLHIHPNHSINTYKHSTPTPLGKVYKTGVSLSNPLFTRPGMHCLDVCLKWYVLHRIPWYLSYPSGGAPFPGRYVSW